MIIKKLKTSFNKPKKRDYKAFIDAVISGNIPVLQQYIDMGMDVNLRHRKNENLSPLHIAAQHDNMEIVRILIENKAKIDTKDDQKGTPLHDAAYYGRDGGVVEFLISRRADIHVRTINQRTPLHIAAWNRNIPGTRALLAARADVNAPDLKNCSPLDLAVKVRNNREVVEMLAIQYGAKLFQVDPKHFFKSLDVREVLTKQAHQWPKSFGSINIYCRVSIMALYWIFTENSNNKKNRNNNVVWLPVELVHSIVYYVIRLWFERDGILCASDGGEW